MKKVYFTFLNALVIISTLALVITGNLFPKIPALMSAKAVAFMKEKDVFVEEYTINEDGTLESVIWKTNS